MSSRPVEDKPAFMTTCLFGIKNAGDNGRATLSRMVLWNYASPLQQAVLDKVFEGADEPARWFDLWSHMVSNLFVVCNEISLTTYPVSRGRRLEPGPSSSSIVPGSSKVSRISDDACYPEGTHPQSEQARQADRAHELTETQGSP